MDMRTKEVNQQLDSDVKISIQIPSLRNFRKRIRARSAQRRTRLLQSRTSCRTAPLMQYHLPISLLRTELSTRLNHQLQRLIPRDISSISGKQRTILQAIATMATQMEDLTTFLLTRITQSSNRSTRTLRPTRGTQMKSLRKIQLRRRLSRRMSA